jgi:hypothetical protein
MEYDSRRMREIICRKKVIEKKRASYRLSPHNVSNRATAWELV